MGLTLLLIKNCCDPLYLWVISSNDADWVHDLRIILIAAQKIYVSDAPLGDRLVAGADVDVMNVW